MKVEYTRHAMLRLEVRSTGRGEVEHVLRSPSSVYYDITANTMIAIGERTRRRGHWLIVVYTRRGDAYRVVTVIDTKSVDKITRRRVSSGRWVKVW